MPVSNANEQAHEETLSLPAGAIGFKCNVIDQRSQTDASDPRFQVAFRWTANSSLTVPNASLNADGCLASFRSWFVNAVIELFTFATNGSELTQTWMGGK